MGDTLDLYVSVSYLTFGRIYRIHNSIYIVDVKKQNECNEEASRRRNS